MAKNIIKKSFSNICISLALILICSLLISLFPHVMGYTPAQRLFFYDMLFKLTAGLSIVAAIGITSYHFIMQTELFFANKAARRVISVIIFALWAFFVLLWVFSSFFFVISETYILVSIALLVLLSVIVTVICFFAEDKMAKKDAEIINKRLSELREEK